MTATDWAAGRMDWRSLEEERNAAELHFRVTVLAGEVLRPEALAVFRAAVQPCVRAGLARALLALHPQRTARLFVNSSAQAMADLLALCGDGQQVLWLVGETVAALDPVEAQAELFRLPPALSLTRDAQGNLRLETDSLNPAYRGCALPRDGVLGRAAARLYRARPADDQDLRAAADYSALLAELYRQVGPGKDVT